jgi:23S rRNA (pseudouridine1915-N3)-methyltransferase
MHSFQILVVGKPKLEAVRALEKHYLAMLRPFARVEVTEFTEGRTGDPARQLREEADKLRPRLLAARCPVLLDPAGPPRSSETFARWLGERMDRGESLAFAIGSSHGFDPALKAEVREKLSLSPMTFPHDLSRVLLLEQLFRGISILKEGPYHK